MDDHARGWTGGSGEWGSLLVVWVSGWVRSETICFPNGYESRLPPWSGRWAFRKKGYQVQWAWDEGGKCGRI